MQDILDFRDWAKENWRVATFDKGGDLPPGDSYVVGQTFNPADYIPLSPGDAKVLEASRFLLENVTGLDVESPHGRGTPERFVRMLIELTTPEPFNFTTFPAEGYDQLITVRNIPFVSLCNHHIIPFVGVANVGY